MSILTKIFGDANEKYLKKLRPIVDKINSLEKTFEGFSDAELKAKTQELKEKIVGKLSNLRGCLDEVLPEAFALVRESAKRTLNQRHFDVQLIGGMVLHEGKIAEMKTGEGKTLAAT
ncbi:MAG: preprotein translocase subunit SecA, partial [Candidatus Nealsonbacteria bacterium]